MIVWSRSTSSPCRPRSRRPNWTSTVTLGRAAEPMTTLEGPMTTLARPGDGRKPFLAGARQGVVEPGVAHPLGATVTPAGVNFCVYAKHATGIDIQFFYAAEDLTPDARRHPRPGGPSHRRVLARARAGVVTGAALRLRGARPVGAATRACASTRPSSCSTRTAAASPSRRATGGSMPASRRHGDHDEERRDRHPAVRLGGRRPAQPAVARDRSSTRRTCRDDRRSRDRASRPSCAARTPG